jgi:hypothetical protein
LICVLGLLAARPAIADDKHGNGRRGENEQGDGDRDGRREERERERRNGEGTKFSDEERQKIYVYCERFGKGEGKHPRSLPPGLAKKVARGGELPPGWQDKCRPGEVMPVEVYQECRPLPRELTVKLPAPPVGTITVAVDGRVVRLLEATREILDVFNVQVRF